MATFAACGALLRLREREVRYSDAVARQAERMAMRDPRPDALERKPLAREGKVAAFDAWLRDRAASPNWPAIHHLWAAALLLFVAADVAAFVCTT